MWRQCANIDIQSINQSIMVLNCAGPRIEPLLLVMQISRGFCELKPLVFALNFDPSIFSVLVCEFEAGFHQMIHTHTDKIKSDWSGFNAM